MKRYSIYLILLLLCVTVMVTACGKEEADTPDTNDVQMSETEESTEADATEPDNGDGSQDTADGNGNENNNDDNNNDGNNNDGNQQADELASVEDKNSNDGPLKSFYCLFTTVSKRLYELPQKRLLVLH